MKEPDEHRAQSMIQVVHEDEVSDDTDEYAPEGQQSLPRARKHHRPSLTPMQGLEGVAPASPPASPPPRARYGGGTPSSKAGRSMSVGPGAIAPPSVASPLASAPPSERDATALALAAEVTRKRGELADARRNLLEQARRNAELNARARDLVSARHQLAEAAENREIGELRRRVVGLGVRLAAASGKEPAPAQPPPAADGGTLVLRAPRATATVVSRLWSRLGDGTLVVALLALTLFAPAAYLAVRRVAHGSGGVGRAHAARGGSLPAGHGLIAGDFVSTCHRDASLSGGAARAARRVLASGELHLWLREDENVVLARGCAPADRGDVLWASNTNSPDVAAAGPREGPLLLQHEGRALVLRDAVNGRVVWRRRVQALPLVLREWPLIAD